MSGGRPMYRWLQVPPLTMPHQVLHQWQGSQLGVVVVNSVQEHARSDQLGPAQEVVMVFAEAYLQGHRAALVVLGSDASDVHKHLLQ